MAGTPIIVAEDVTKRFGANQVLTRVSLPVMERDVVCVVGPSGSGKTTLLRCLALLEKPSEGRIVMQGTAISTPEPDRQVRSAARAVRSDIGMVFQHFNLWPHLSVLENLIEAPLRVKGMSKDQAVAIAETLLAKVDLSDKRDEGMTMLVVTHEMGFARHVGTRTVFMDRGEIVEEAPGAAFFDSPQTERAQRFLKQFEEE